MFVNRSCFQSILDLEEKTIDKIFHFLDFADRSRARVNKKLMKIEKEMTIDKEEGRQWTNVCIKACF